MLATTVKIRLEEFEGKEIAEVTESWPTSAPSSEEARERVRAGFDAILAFIDQTAVGVRFSWFERDLFRRVFQLGRLFVALFLTLAEERTVVPTWEHRGRKRFRRQPAKPRLLATLFGRLEYWRVYMFQTNGKGGGYFPLDLRLGLTADGFTTAVVSCVVQLATKVSYATAAVLMARFLGWAPSTKTIEKAVLGLGQHTEGWFEQVEAPDGDGEVLVIQIDSKATPTARDSELALRRGKRRKDARAPSPRHRGRRCRAARPPKRRRKKGDKSKNGKATTLLVMYTLKSGRDAEGLPILLGPINRRLYASYAPKRHAFAIASREADKRGFADGSGKLVHILTDGDPDLACYAKEFFPNALHSLDVIHVVEKLWEAGACFLPESSEELSVWMETQKDHLYAGRIDDLLAELRMQRLPLKAGQPRVRLQEIINYMAKRTAMMRYDDLIARDLDLSTGSAEGAIRFVVSQRFDEGGMRWIKERAEALLQLRCIEINGDWDRFIDFAEDRIMSQQERSLRPKRQLRNRPKPLPRLGVRLC